MSARRLLCLILTSLFLLSLSSALADEDWANAPVERNRMPEHIDIIPWDEIPEPRMGQHHYLLLCIDQWESKPRPADAPPPTAANGQRRDLYGNTDGMVILTLDTAARRIMITSIVRDAAILKPISTEDRQYYGRINYVYNDYGPEALCKLISEHLGIRIEKYILFNFSQIEDIIDLECLDGVYVTLRKDSEFNEIRYLATWAVPKYSVIEASGYFAARGDPLALHYVTKNDRPLDFSIPAAPFAESTNGNGHVKESFSVTGTGGAVITFNRNGSCVITLEDGTAEKGSYSFAHNRLAVMTGADVHGNERAPAGLYHMTGHAALLYMRIRKASSTDTDFMRTQRVRNVLSALADQCRTFTLDEANDLANSIMQHNDATNMTLKEILDAAAMAYGLRDCTIEEFRVPAQDDVRSITFGNMSALEINWTSTREKFLQFVDHTMLVRDEDFLVQDDGQ